MIESPKKSVSFQFAEEMKGFLSTRQNSYEGGYEQGKANNNHFMFHLKITIDDLDVFLNFPEHQARASGYVEGSIVGVQRPISSGFFNLFINSNGQNQKEMRYRLFFEDGNGNPMTLSGFKRIQDNLGLDVLADSTTLYTNLYLGHLQELDEVNASIYACGILHILLPDFMHQLTTMRADAPSFIERIEAFEKFGKFFLGSLWEVYGLPISPKITPYEREIPLFTMEGVQGATKTTHPYTTDDRLGGNLLRFLREPSEDVVVLIHGLTASSDMFIMPEHYNLVQYLLDQGFTDVWTMDVRFSNRYSYNLNRNTFNVDDTAMYDHPAAIATVRKVVGPKARIHIIAHCFGAMSFSMSLFSKKVTDVHSVILNAVAITPRVQSRTARIKLQIAPFLVDYILGFEYLNPLWHREHGGGLGKLFAWFVSKFHRECNVPECHMTSFMWGFGFPVLFKHENLNDITHRRTGDLFGGCSVNYYRHMWKMVRSNNTAVKYLPNDTRYQSLPDNYFAYASEIKTPILFVTGQENKVFYDSNIICFERLEKIAPGRHELHVFPHYGHADVFIGKNVAQDIFPKFVDFLNRKKKES
jgi:cholesterol oxidase